MLRIPVLMSLADAKELEAETVTVSKHGAKVRIPGLPRPLQRGEPLSITISKGRRSRSARVVWLDEGDDSLYGVEINPAGSFWGVFFPSLDNEDTYVDPPLLAPEIEPAAPITTCCTESSSSKVEESEPPPPPVQAAAELATDSQEFEAMLTGMSAARMLFSEKTVWRPTQTREATALVSHLLGAGTRVRIARVRDRVVEFGRVSGVSRRREAGKWRIWVQLLS